MTYFLEKLFTVDFYTRRLVPYKYMHCLIRPCKASYQEVLNAFNDKSKDKELTLDGQIASYSIENNSKFSSIEEWLIWLDLEKGISPDFEEIRIMSDFTFDEYVVKTVDLHTKKAVFDNLDKVLKSNIAKLTRCAYS